MSVAGRSDTTCRRRVRAGLLLALLPALPAQAGGCDSPLQLVFPADRPPLSSSAQGHPQGRVVDLLDALQDLQPALQIRPVSADVLADGRLPAGTQAVLGWSQRQLPPRWLASDPYLQVPQVIVRRRDAPPLIDLGGLRGQSVASPDPSPLAELLQEQAPGAVLLPPTPLDQALHLLASAQIDAVVANLAEADHLLRQAYAGQLQVAAPAGFSDALVLATVPACRPWLQAFNQHLATRALPGTPAPEGRAPPVAVAADAAPRPWLRWLVAALLALLSLGLVYALGYWRLHREGQRRRTAMQRLQDVTASLPAVVYRTRRSSSGKYSVLQIDGDVNALFGVSLDTARIDHSRLLAAVHPDDRAPVLAQVDAAALVRGPIDVTFRARAREGWRWLRSQGRPIACRDSGDSGMEWTGYWIDVTESQMRADALNDARREAEQAAAAKAHFLATMSHEIRTPMSTLLGMLERLGGTALEPRQRQLLVTIEDASTVLRTILDEVLDSQLLQPGAAASPPVPTDLAALLGGVQRLLAPMASSKGLYLRCVIDPALQAGTRVDGLRLRQILFNLVGNALKFTLHGGVELRLQVMGQPPGGQQLRLQVVDTGVGISQARQRAVFAPYTQAEASTSRRFGGSGLGLAICRDLAITLGGELQLHSTLGQGTTVCLDLFLPACEAPPAAPPRPVAASASLPPVHVLVAEDHPTNRELLVGRLRDLGLQVHAADDGAQALQAWQQQRFALVITDCQMPGMDGPALARAIRADPRADAARVPIIALTASALDSTREACRAAGIDRFLAKPVERDVLRETIAALLASSR